MTLSAALGNAGARHQIEYRGRVYGASLVVQDVKTHLTRWLQRRAYRPILVMGEVGERPETVDRAIARFEARCEAREFEFDEAKAKKLFDPERPDPEAAVAFTAILFGCDEATALGMMLAKPVEVKLVVELVMRESFGPNGAGVPAGPTAAHPQSNSSSPA